MRVKNIKLFIAGLVVISSYTMQTNNVYGHGTIENHTHITEQTNLENNSESAHNADTESNEQFSKENNTEHHKDEIKELTPFDEFKHNIYSKWLSFKTSIKNTINRLKTYIAINKDTIFRNTSVFVGISLILFSSYNLYKLKENNASNLE